MGISATLFQLDLPLIQKHEMKELTYALGVVGLLLTSAFTMYNVTPWSIAEGYEVKFTSDNPTGIFTDLKGEILFDANDLDQSSFNMTVGVASINTGNGMQNKHAKSDKWFDAETYPQITFKSSSISQTDNGYETTGMLKMHGVEKEITFPFTFENQTFKGSFMIKRTDYNIGSTKGMSGKASTDLQVDIAVPVTQ